MNLETLTNHNYLCNLVFQKLNGYKMKYLNYILIILGSFVAISAKSGTEQNEYILIGGIALLMIGIYRISKTIPSKQDTDDTDDFIKEE
jgi:hypothetical membrane protein